MYRVMSCVGGYVICRGSHHTYGVMSYLGGLCHM